MMDQGRIKVKHKGLMIFLVILLILAATVLWMQYRIRSQSAQAEQRIEQDRQEEHAASKVYFTNDLTSEGMIRVYEALGFQTEGTVAIKLSTGEAGGNYYLHPDLIQGIVDRVDGTIVECNTAYGGSRAATAEHMQVAKDHGFTEIAEVDIMDAQGSVSLPVEDGIFMKENLVGSNLENYGSMIVLSHFKGHAMAGYGGAIKNISIGIASASGKSLIHSSGSFSASWGWMAGAMFKPQEHFLAAMAESGKSVSEYFGNGDNIVYINVLNNISIDCDCDSNPSVPEIHDIGILASTDPVALDQACIDLVYGAEGSSSLINRIEDRNGLYTLDYAQAIGLGSKEYELISIDE